MSHFFLTQASSILRSVHSRRSFEEIADQILKCAVQNSGSDHGSFIRVDWETETLMIVASHGRTWTRDKIHNRVKVGRGITGIVAESGQIYNCADVNSDPNYISFHPTVISELGVPIKVDGRVWGVLNLDSDQYAHYKEETVLKMELLTEMVASALEYRIQSERERNLSLSLAESEKLSTMGHLVAGIAHEVNNPLAAILGAAELFHESTGNAEFDEAIAIIRKQAIRAGSLVKQLLSFARTGSHEDRSHQNICEVVREAIDLVRPQMVFSGVDLKTDIATGHIPSEVNRVQIQQIVVNLITNAQQAIAETGTKDGRIQVRTQRVGDAVVIQVIDNGPGMSKETLSQIFQPFFTTKETGKGTGLGLSICKEIADAHHGELICISEPGKGCEFSLTLPVCEPAASSPELAAEETEEPRTTFSRKPNILIIDDEAPIRWMLKRLFTPVADRLVVTGSAEHGLEVAQEDAFDLIISDLHLPGMDGIEMRNRLGENTNTRFVLITGDASSSRIADFSQMDGVQVIQKPFELDKLLTISLKELSLLKEIALTN